VLHPEIGFCSSSHQSRRSLVLLSENSPLLGRLNRHGIGADCPGEFVVGATSKSIFGMQSAYIKREDRKYKYRVIGVVLKPAKSPPF